MPNAKGNRRRFGSIRKTPLGEYQASYVGPDGRRHFAPHRFKRQRDADGWLAAVQTAISAESWTDPDKARIALGQYAEQWIGQRPGLRPRTVELYRWLLRKHIAPGLGETRLASLTPAMVRRWRAELLTEHAVSETMAAKSYRLLRAVLNTAVNEDKLLASNPCRIRRADRESSPERPRVTVAQVFRLADAMPDRRFRMLVLLAAFGSLRWGEITALRRCDVAEDGSSVRIAFAHSEVRGRGIVIGPPKSRAGVRTVAIPVAVRADFVGHLKDYVDQCPDSLVFTGVQGRSLRRGSWGQRVKWTALVRQLDMEGVHFHDLRHAGNIWASKAGISTKDLMARMGHDDMRAALIYQQATGESDRLIAERLSDLIDKHHGRSPEGHRDDGSAGAPSPSP